MKKSLQVFERLMKSVESDVKLYTRLRYERDIPEKEDVLRWIWAQSVSAFDKLIHDLVLRGVIEAYIGRRSQTSAFNNFRLTMADHLRITAASSGGVAQLEKIVAAKNATESYQDPRNVSAALALIWDEDHRWQIIAKSMKSTEDDVKGRLRLIVQRRNQIVHEGDYSSQLLQRQSLTLSDARSVVRFVKRLGRVIAKCVI